MKLPGPYPAHLSYCTNVHAGERSADVLHQLRELVPRVKAAVSPTAPMGVGLRVSAAATADFQHPLHLEALRHALSDNDLYVFTLNGFPFGNFHRGRVKEKVYRPDWRDPKRVQYTAGMGRLLARLMPEHLDYGSISTVPCGFKADLAGDHDISFVSGNLIEAAADLARIREASGRTIVLALEPEPCCYLETIAETVAFFEHHLFSPGAVKQMMSIAGTSAAEAERILRRHLGVCLDLCHLAVEFETASDAVTMLSAAGICIAKVQISAGLRVPAVDDAVAKTLAGYDDGIYLHQVVERSGGTLRRYTDLDEALATTAGPNCDREWRIHFHVPVFASTLGSLSSTQSCVESFLSAHKENPLCPHLEVETYTWEVLPPALRPSDLCSAIARELTWVRDRVA
jgi:hypothetical protein